MEIHKESDECQHKNIKVLFKHKDPVCVTISSDVLPHQQIDKIIEAIHINPSFATQLELRDEEDNIIDVSNTQLLAKHTYQLYLLNNKEKFIFKYDKNLSESQINAIISLENSNCKSLIADSVTQKKYLCPFETCRKTFNDTQKVSIHIKIHNGDRPYICNFNKCNKSFTTKGHLKSHESIHEDAGNYLCEVCKKQFNRRKRYKIHMLSHNTIKPYRCEYKHCNKSFTEKGNLKTHLRIHTGEKPYKCTMESCTKSFTTQGHLTDHLRRHTGTRPFSCDFCERTFMRSSTLKSHLRRHTGEKPYRCDYPNCNKTFKESRNLKTHYKIHTGIRIFACEGCFLRFGNRQQYEEHKIQCIYLKPSQIPMMAPFSHTQILQPPLPTVLYEANRPFMINNGVFKQQNEAGGFIQMHPSFMHNGGTGIFPLYNEMMMPMNIPSQNLYQSFKWPSQPIQQQQQQHQQLQQQQSKEQLETMSHSPSSPQMLPNMSLVNKNKLNFFSNNNHTNSISKGGNCPFEQLIRAEGERNILETTPKTKSPLKNTTTYIENTKISAGRTFSNIDILSNESISNQSKNGLPDSYQMHGALYAPQNVEVGEVMGCGDILNVLADRICEKNRGTKY